MKMSLALLLVFSLFIHGTFGEIICEELPIEMCSFSIAWTGKRCLLETYDSKEGNMELQCKTSEVIVKNMADLIETDECVSACGIERKTVGISSDNLLEPKFTTRLCSPDCYQNCHNIVELYHNLATGEGLNLQDLCEVQRSMPRRAIFQVVTSGEASAATSETETASAAAPISAAEAPTSNDIESVACAPTSI